MDLDSFYVSVELLRQPSLRGKPLIIGGAGDRGVVASCSYEARKSGVHSAMPSRKAKELCPEAIWVSGDMEEYGRYSRIVHDIIASKAPLFEQASIDEFYLDISGMDKFYGAFKWARELRQYIIKETGLPISFGLSVNKTVSKIATGECKPNGELYIPAGEEKAFLAPLPVEKIPMVGKKTADRLHEAGITHVHILSQTPAHVLEEMLGKNGLVLWQRANGIDDTPVEPDAERKSISTETTFATDIADARTLRLTLLKMVEELAYSLRSENYLAGCIALKLRYAGFETETRQCSFPFTSADAFFMEKATELFEKHYNRKKALRLIGVRLSNLVRGSHQLNLFGNAEKSVQLYEAMDKIRQKFGQKAVRRALE